MRRSLLVVVLASLATASVAQQQPYHEVRIEVADRTAVQEVAALGELDHFHVDRESVPWVIEAVIGDLELTRVMEAGFGVDVVSQDVAAQVEARSAQCPASFPDFVPDGFFYGSMGCYPTLDETISALDQMHAARPDLVSYRVSIGQSWEERDIWMVRMTAAEDPDAVPQALYTSLHHAREPQSLAAVLYFMYYLLDGYGTDPEVTALLDNRALYFIPVLNPDGYLHNQLTNPSGGGMWRKNRRNNGSSFGVDLNRNYSYQWGGSGSSGLPSSQTYRGPSPFSEPETQALRLWMHGRQIAGAYNYHSFGNMWLHPWGYAPGMYTADHDVFTDLGEEITRYNGLVFGTAADILYNADGTSDDWMYGDQLEIGKVYAWTPELGTSADHFWPAPERIVPLAEMTVHPNLILAWFVGVHPRDVTLSAVAEANHHNGFLDPGEEGVFHVAFDNLGVGAMDGARARIITTEPLAADTGPWSEPFAITERSHVELPPLLYTIPADSPLGPLDGFALELELEGGRAAFDLGPVEIGTPVFALNETFASFGDWTLNQWGPTTNASTPPFAVTDSPQGNYPNNVINTLRLRQPLDLSEADEATLRFRANWSIQEGLDYVQARVSTNNNSWTALAGNHTSVGSGEGVQPLDQPLYDGVQSEWVKEVIDLNAYIGQPNLYLQFRMQSGPTGTASGFVLDDVQVITGYINGSGAVSTEPGTSLDEVVLYVPYPNPTGNATHIRFTLPEPGAVTLNAYDVLGRRVVTLADDTRDAGSHVLSWDLRTSSGSELSSGVYVLVLTTNGTRSTQRLTITR